MLQDLLEAATTQTDKDLMETFRLKSLGLLLRRMEIAYDQEAKRRGITARGVFNELVSKRWIKNVITEGELEKHVKHQTGHDKSQRRRQRDAGREKLKKQKTDETRAPVDTSVEKQLTDDEQLSAEKSPKERQSKKKAAPVGNIQSQPVEDEEERRRRSREVAKNYARLGSEQDERRRRSREDAENYARLEPVQSERASRLAEPLHPEPQYTVGPSTATGITYPCLKPDAKPGTMCTDLGCLPFLFGNRK